MTSPAARRVVSGVLVALLLSGCLLIYDFDGIDTNARIPSGTDAGDFSIDEIAPLVLARGEKGTLRVRVSGSADFVADVAISSEGVLPEGLEIGAGVATSAARDVVLTVTAGNILLDRAKVTLIAASGDVVRRRTFEMSVVPEDRLDVGFGDGGVVVSDSIAVATPFNPHSRVVVFRADGAGYVRDGQNVHAFSANGAPVPQFGDGGSVSVPAFGAPALTLDDAGNLVVAFVGSGPRVHVYGATGETIVAFDLSQPSNLQLVAGTRGSSLLVAGQRSQGIDRILQAEHRFLDGGTDPTFAFSPPPGSLFYVIPIDVHATPAGGWVLGGYEHGAFIGGRAVRSVLIRILDDGSKPGTFGNAGTATTQAGNATVQVCYGASAVSDNNVVSAVLVDDNGDAEGCIPTSTRRGVVTRVGLADGALDPTFADGGAVELPLAPLVLNDITAETDGRIVTVGATGITDSFRPVLVRLLANGTPDPSLKSLTSTAGTVIPVPGTSAEAFGVALVGPHILVAGIAYGTPNRLFLARYFR